jgi:hypothetical protein
LTRAGFGDTSADELKRVFRELCTIESPDDGLTFLTEGVHVEAIREDQEYGGMQGYRDPGRTAARADQRRRRRPEEDSMDGICATGQAPELADAADLSAVVATLDRLLWPVLQAAAEGKPWARTWSNGGPWKESQDGGRAATHADHSRFRWLLP